MPADYEYDVFISYKRQRLKSEWLIEQFLPLFEENLENEVGALLQRPLRKIFFDQREVNPALRQFDNRMNGIEPGANWQKELRHAIKNSACMVGVWSPPYFFSEWCRIEWKSFGRRDQMTGASTIVPISVHDGTSFPTEARALQYIDMSNHTFIGTAFPQTVGHIEFQKLIRALATSVASAIKNAPTYRDWPVEDGPNGDPLVPQQQPIQLTSFAHGNG